MKTTYYFIQPYLVFVLLIAVLIDLTGCATPVSQKPNAVDKKELAVRLQSCTSFIGVANEQAKSSADKKAQEILNKAQYLAHDAKEDFKHERYIDAQDKVNEAYRLGLTAWDMLSTSLPATSKEQKNATG